MSRTSNFTNSPLATLKNIHGSKKNGSGNFTRRITKITIHHAAGVISGANLLAWGHNPVCGASWNYGIGNDGVIGQMIEEKDRAWTSSSPSNDYQAVTIEVSNSATGGNWPVGDKAYAALINLCVDICKRNNIPRLTFDGTPNGSLTHHSMFASTSCPGKFLSERFNEICKEVNKQLGTISNASNTSATASTPPPASAPTPARSTSVLAFKVGDIVQFTGGAVYTSSNAATPAHSRGKSRCKVTKTFNGRNPYHLVSEDEGGVHGWVAAVDVQAITTPAAEIKVGSRVRLKSGAKTFTGGGISAFVFNDTWIVHEIRGDRVVINRNVSGRNAIMTPVNVRDLTLV